MQRRIIIWELPWNREAILTWRWIATNKRRAHHEHLQRPQKRHQQGSLGVALTITVLENLRCGNVIGPVVAEGGFVTDKSVSLSDSFERGQCTPTPRRQEIADDWRGKVQQRRLSQVSFVHIARLPSARVAGTITACSSYRVKGLFDFPSGGRKAGRFVRLIGAMTRKYAARTPDVNDRRTRGRVMQRATMRVCVAA